MDQDDSTPEPAAPVTELLADEVADVALDDPERAAQLVAAVAPGRSSPGPSAEAPSIASPPPVPPPSFAPGGAGAADGSPMQEQALPAALVVVLLLQVLAKGRFRRLVLAAVGGGLIATLVRGTSGRS